MRDPALLDEKRALRAEIRRRLAGLTSDDQSRAGHTLADSLSPLVDVVAAGPIALFSSLPHELDTAPLDRVLLARGRTRLLPAIVDGDLVFRAVPVEISIADLPKDPFGIPTPDETCARHSLDEAALVFVPGAAIDDDGARLGWGKGFYDRALAALVRPVLKVGLFHDVQRVARVPHDALDVPIDVTCSPSQVRMHRPLPGPVESAIHAGFARRGDGL